MTNGSSTPKDSGSGTGTQDQQGGGAGAGARVHVPGGVVPRGNLIGRIGSTIGANRTNVAAFSEGAMAVAEAMACVARLRTGHPGLGQLTSADDPDLLLAILEFFVMHGDSERSYNSETEVVLSVGGNEITVTINSVVMHMFDGGDGGQFPIKRFTRAFPVVVKAILSNPTVVTTFQQMFGQDPIVRRSALLPAGYKAKYDEEEITRARETALWEERDHTSGATSYQGV